MSPETEEKIEGAHNFRQVCGFPVFGVGQPNPEGIKVALEKIKGSCDEKNNKILWFNLRKELGLLIFLMIQHFPLLVKEDSFSLFLYQSYF